MPLPDADTPWPPPEHAHILDQLRVFDAWYTGDRDMLATVYGGVSGYAYGGDAMVRNRPSQYRGGVAGRLSRFFWGEPVPGGHRRLVKMHIPAAADIATTSAGLLFADPPTVTAADEASQARLDELLDDRFWDTIMDAAELAAGLGGVFLRVGWDTDVFDRPIVTAVGPDLAIPKFRFGKLVEVTFTWRLHCDTPGMVMRHLENHRMTGEQDSRLCVVEHALYQGDEDSLGRRAPLTEHPDTAPLVEAIDESGTVPTGLDRLDVVYVPNVPSRKWRKQGVGADMGQPDIAGVEPLLDALDEAWTSWMRDIRLGKSRVIVSQAWLTSHGPGKGGHFDLDEELMVKVNIPPTQDAPLELIQPQIRHESHAATCMGLLERCVDGAGYSLQTFGLNTDVAMTATESNARDQKTDHTVGGKIRRWKPGLSDIVLVILAVDAQVFSSGVKVAAPTITWPPTVDLQSVANSAQMLRAAEAASTDTLVAMTQPGLDETARAAEVQRIKDEQSAKALPLMADGFDNPHDPGHAPNADPAANPTSEANPPDTSKRRPTAKPGR